MSCRVQKAHGVVLTVDIDKSSAQLPQNRSRCRHSVDAAGAFALGCDLAAEHQCIRALVARLLKAVQHRTGHLLKGCTDHRLGGPCAHKIL